MSDVRRPGGHTAEVDYSEAGDLAAVRAFVRTRAEAHGLAPDRADLLVLAVSELATNTLQHGTGGGRVTVWARDGQLVCEVLDQGPARDFGRAMPPADAVRGRGLAIVERVCDDVSSTTGAHGTVVRLGLTL
ncbi:ATP-binding protein [Asanoa sp. WMMD1127]|uniref:ATP-binding protein n=1 Tax=Asanoa sp. WMMD1127 TaxID=3016107 RepID=UPI002417B2E2|nr:ATP-binding protein [Asanoa sp. WMMD1127]MDG4824755.1 ATP-binding protein [Asanoa sp. WMMD1127]